MSWLNCIEVTGSGAAWMKQAAVMPFATAVTKKQMH